MEPLKLDGAKTRGASNGDAEAVEGVENLEEVSLFPAHWRPGRASFVTAKTLLMATIFTILVYETVMN